MERKISSLDLIHANRDSMKNFIESISNFVFNELQITLKNPEAYKSLFTYLQTKQSENNSTPDTLNFDEQQISDDDDIHEEVFEGINNSVKIEASSENIFDNDTIEDNPIDEIAEFD